MGYVIGDVHIDVILTEDDDYSTPATDHALEDNTEMSDHVTKDPRTLNLECIVIDPDNQKINKLRQYQENADIIDYNNLTQLQHIVIENTNVSRSADIKDGYNLSISFKQIKVAYRKQVVLTSGAVERATRNKQQMGLHIPKETSKEGKD